MASHLRGGFFLKTFLAGFIMLGAVLGVSLFSASDSYAASCGSTRYSCNADESRARNICDSNSAGVVEGAIWFNNSGSAATTDGYYALGVNIAADATSVSVNIRGSVFSCRQNVTVGNHVYAVNVSANSAGGAYPQSYRLSVSGTLDRGAYNGWYQWTTRGSTLTGTLNVSGLAANNNGKTDSQTITIGLYRCFSSNGWSVTGSCATAGIPVTVTRAAKPVYTLTPTISVDRSGAVSPGDEVGVSPKVTSTGGAKSPNTQWQVTRFVVPPGQSYPTTLQHNGSTPENHYKHDATNVKSGTQQFSAGVTNLSGYNEITENLAVGTRICYALSVKPYTNTNSTGNWAHGVPVCIIVSKKPKVNILGGDLLIRNGGTTSGDITTSVTLDNRSQVEVTQEDIEQQIRNTQKFWYFGKGAGLEFKENGTVTTPKTKDMVGNEGSTVATNGKGEVQFMTDGLNIYDKKGDIINNGAGMGSTSSTTQAAATFPLSGNRYAVVTSSAVSEGNQMGQLYYSIVDMNAQGGKGSVTVKKQPLGPHGSAHYIGEAMSVAPNATKDGYWVVVNRPGTKIIRAFKVSYTWNGLNGSAIPYVDSNTGTKTSGKNGGTHAPGFGSINFNADYSRMVIAMQNPNPSNGTFDNTVRVLTFNRSTGKFNEIYAWNVGDYYLYSADFSPQGKYVYVSTLYNPPGGNGGNGHLYRYKIDGMAAGVNIRATEFGIAHGSTAMPACGTKGAAGQVKRAIDGKMYVARIDCTVIGVINNPDSPTNSNAAIGWNMSGRSLPSGAKSTFGLPQVAAVLEIDQNPPVYEQRSYGSWGEYGVVSPGKVTGMGSAASYSGGTTENNFCKLSLLSFSNVPVGGSACVAAQVGKYTLPPLVRTVAAQFPVSTATTVGTSVDVSSLAANRVYTRASGTITLSQSAAMPANKWVVINAPNADVVISGSLTYTTGTLTSAKSIPQLVIIARNIILSSEATQVDAWLVATGTGTNGRVNTCGAGAVGEATALNAGRCDKFLQVNGPVVANHLLLRRTAGSGPDKAAGNPAEVFNLRPDAYMWASVVSGANKARTVTTTELPPRF